MPDNLKTFIKSELEKISNKDEMISKLKEINKKFITEYKIQINYNNKNLTIIPIETEIYFSKFSSEKPDDGMCHMNELQKGFVENEERFGKLYFHRAKRSRRQKASIDKSSYGGIDISLSNGDYFLSILIRCAYINNKLICGINKIRQKVLDDLDLDIKQDEKIIKEIIENIKVIYPKEDKDKYKNHKVFVYQNRIVYGRYSIDGMTLNIIINDEDIFNEIDKIKNKENIVSAVRTHYRYIRTSKEFDFKKNLIIKLSIKQSTTN